MAKAPVNLIEGALKELKNVLFSSAFMQGILDSLVFILLTLFILSLIGIQWVFSFIPFAIYLIIHVPNVVKSYNLRSVGNHVPGLYEPLRTAADNLDKDNEVIKSLQEDVIKGMKNIYSSFFIKFKKIYLQVGLLILLTAGIVLAGSFNFKIFDVYEAAEDIKEFSINRINAAKLFVQEENPNEEFYGDETLTVIGSENLDLEINPVSSEININDVSKVTERDFVEEKAASLGIRAEKGFTDDVPRDYQKVVKTYFTQITKSGG